MHRRTEWNTRFRGAVLCDAPDGLCAQLLIGLRGDLCLCRLNISRVIDVVTAGRVVARLFGTNEISTNFCSRERNTRLREANNRRAEDGNGESETQEYLFIPEILSVDQVWRLHAGNSFQRGHGRLPLEDRDVFTQPVRQ